MADQDLISNAEQLLMFDDNNENPLLDDLVNGMVEELGGNVAGNNQFPALLRNDDQNTEYTNFPQFSEFGNPIPIPIWPIPPSPYTCTCCQTLREISHVNGSISFYLTYFVVVHKLN